MIYFEAQEGLFVNLNQIVSFETMDTSDNGTVESYEIVLSNGASIFVAGEFANNLNEVFDGSDDVDFFGNLHRGPGESEDTEDIEDEDEDYGSSLDDEEDSYEEEDEEDEDEEIVYPFDEDEDDDESDSEGMCRVSPALDDDVSFDEMLTTAILDAIVQDFKARIEQMLPGKTVKALNLALEG